MPIKNILGLNPCSTIDHKEIIAWKGELWHPANGSDGICVFKFVSFSEYSRNEGCRGKFVPLGEHNIRNY